MNSRSCELMRINADPATSRYVIATKYHGFFCTISLTDCITFLRHWSKLLSNLNGLHVINLFVKSPDDYIGVTRLFNRYLIPKNTTAENEKTRNFLKTPAFSFSKDLNYMRIHSVYQFNNQYK